MSIHNWWDALWQHWLGLMCHLSSHVWLHLLGRNQFLSWLHFPPRKLPYWVLSFHFHLLYSAFGCSVIDFSALALWFKVFLYCLSFAHGCDIIDLCGLELWAEVLPRLIYQLLQLKQPVCPHPIPSLFTVFFFPWGSAVYSSLKSRIE